MFSSEKEPWKYFMDDMLSGNSLRNTTTAGNEKERERVYDTIFRLPWRCELVNSATWYFHTFSLKTNRFSELGGLFFVWLIVLFVLEQYSEVGLDFGKK